MADKPITLTTGLRLPDPVKPGINIGAGFDIPTGDYYKGPNGEKILNGGLLFVNGVSGPPNSFKSTVAYYMSLSALARTIEGLQYGYPDLVASPWEMINSMDTETNVSESRLVELTQTFSTFKHRDIIREGLWAWTDKVQTNGELWYESVKKWLEAKTEAGNTFKVTTPWVSPRDGKQYKMFVPTFTNLDSISDFSVKTLDAVQNDVELGGGGAANTLALKAAGVKYRLMQEVPGVAAKAGNYFTFIAHKGEHINLQQSPGSAPPRKILSSMSQDERLKHVPRNFYTATHSLWDVVTRTSLINRDTKLPEYPKDADDNVESGRDLWLITMKQLRGKAGPSEVQVAVVVSQSEGVLPDLSNFHRCRVNGQFGLTVSAGNYRMDLLPDVVMKRTTVRKSLEENPLLARAVEITSEMLQMQQLWHSSMDKRFMMTPKELYTKIKELGFDWGVLLQTRGWYTFDNGKHPLKYLSTMDLLEIACGIQPKPYWL